jgi:cytoskeletal protein CcmA (bactofilin family)
MFKKAFGGNSKNDDNFLGEENDTVVGPSVHVQGDFVSEGNIIVKGMVSGQVKTAQVLTVHEGAKITASVRASDAIIAGEIEGDVKVDGKLEILNTASIHGNIICDILSVEAGALILGKITMKMPEMEEKKTKEKVEKRKKLGKINENNEIEEAREENLKEIFA